MPENAPSRSNRLSVPTPTRGADRNQSLVDRANPEANDVLFPSLEDGITLLDVEGGRGVPVIQSLVLDHLLVHDGPAFWVDTKGHATTTTLAQIAPSQRLLDRIQVARGFTAYQHYGAVCDLPSAVNQYIKRTTTAEKDVPPIRTAHDDQPAAQTPSVIVAPAVDAHYWEDDTLEEIQAATLQARTIARLRSYSVGYDAPVLLTRQRADQFTAPIERASDHYIECRQTAMGPRFGGEEFETLVYPVDDGAYYQTTFAYWRQLLGARAKQVGVEPTPSASSTEHSSGVGTGVTADGETATLTANPLVDAWRAAGGGR